MRYADAIVARLADPQSRERVFDETALANVLASAYDADAISATGPLSAVFDEVRFGVASRRLAALDGGWTVVGCDDRTEARFTIAGLTPAGVRAEAYWRGALVARVAIAAAPITEARSQWDAADGDRESGTVAVTFAAPADGGTAIRQLPLAAAVLIRAAEDFGLSELLADSADLREQLAGLAPRTRALEPRPRHPVIVVWIVPEAVFDDDDWPGAPAGASPAAARDARRERAAAWLSGEGVALAVVAPT